MKLTCMMIVVVLFLTAWTFVMADDSRDGLENLFPKAHHEMKNSEASKKSELNKRCRPNGETCNRSDNDCCSCLCLFVCVT
uniref:Conotoxin n=1 Tax=Conus betulinus TaxID=89764 RepID=A0A142C1L0_CONBE|nr:conotoxin [Conus betulinus]